MYNALSDLGVTADLVRPEEDLSRYKLVLAPNSVLVGKAAARNFEAYVEQGGHIVFGVRSGLKDENNVMVDIPWPGLLGRAVRHHGGGIRGVSRPCMEPGVLSGSGL